MTFTGVGTCLLDADQSGDGVNWDAAPTASQSWSIVPAPQTISFTTSAPSPAVYGTTYSPVATSTSGLDVQLSIDSASAGTCSFTSSTTVLFTAGTGTCVLDANQPGNSDYDSAPEVQQIITVGPATQTIAFTPSSLPSDAVYGGTFTPVATASSNLPVSITVDPSAASVCAFTSSTTVMLTTTGTCVLDASQAGNSDYQAAAPVQQDVTVGKASQTIAFTPSSLPSNPSVGDTFTPAATASSNLTVSITVDPSAASVCAFTSSTMVQFTSTGTCVLDASQPGNPDYDAATQSQDLTVGKASQAITIPSDFPTTAVYDGTYDPTATASSNLAVQFSVDATSNGTCAFTSSTVLTFTAPGACVVDANQPGDSNYDPAPEVQQTITVGPATQSVSITSMPTSSESAFDGSYNPTATASSGLAVQFSIDPSTAGACAYIPATNEVNYTDVGNCQLDASQPGNADWQSASATPQIWTIQAAAQSIKLLTTPPSFVVYSGTSNQSFTISAAGGGSGLPVNFIRDPSSGDTCTVVPFGTSRATVYVGGAIGTCTIDANQSGVTDGSGQYVWSPAPEVQDSIIVGPPSSVVQSIAFTTNPPSFPVEGGSYQPSAAATSGLPVQFSIDPSSTSGACTFSSGSVDFTGTGGCEVDANQTGNTEYASAPEVHQSFTIVKEVPQLPQTISITSSPPTSAEYSGSNNQKYSVKATSSSGLPVSLVIDRSSTSVCTISGATVAYGRRTGACVIDANQSGDSSYAAAPAFEQSFTVRAPRISAKGLNVKTGTKETFVGRDSRARVGSKLLVEVFGPGTLKRLFSTKVVRLHYFFWTSWRLKPGTMTVRFLAGKVVIQTVNVKVVGSTKKGKSTKGR
ncbi:MAG: hypothetical protein WCF24_00165 [Acidimicrobiales bacterium]